MAGYSPTAVILSEAKDLLFPSRATPVRTAETYLNKRKTALSKSIKLGCEGRGPQHGSQATRTLYRTALTRSDSPGTGANRHIPCRLRARQIDHRLRAIRPEYPPRDAQPAQRSGIRRSRLWICSLAINPGLE